MAAPSNIGPSGPVVPTLDLSTARESARKASQASSQYRRNLHTTLANGITSESDKKGQIAQIFTEREFSRAPLQQELRPPFTTTRNHPGTPALASVSRRSLFAQGARRSMAQAPASNSAAAVAIPAKREERQSIGLPKPSQRISGDDALAQFVNRAAEKPAVAKK